MAKSAIILTLCCFTVCSCVTQEVEVRRHSVIRDSEAELPLVDPLPTAHKPEHSPAASKNELTKSNHPNAEHDQHQDNSQQAMLALHGLMQGNARFTQGKSLHALQNEARRLELANGQKPETIVLSCSDSRASPEIIFDKGLGELFVVRTAGEVAESSALASIEYAIEHLHAKLILVMGHTSCGAVKAALTTPEDKSAGSAHLDKLVGMIRPALKGMHIVEGDKKFTEAVKANIKSVATSLAARSTIVREALVSKQVLLVQGIYNLDSGQVEFWF